MPSILMAFGVAVFSAITTLALGYLVLSTVGYRGSAGTSWRNSGIAMATGLSVLAFSSHALLALGPLAFYWICAIGVPAIWLSRRYLISEVVTGLQAVRTVSFKTVPLALLSTGVFALMLIRALTPSTEGDALSGYLVTAQWFAENGIRYCPYNARYSLMPTAIEQVWALVYRAGGDLAVKCFDWHMGLALFALIYQVSRTYASHILSWCAGMTLLVTPALSVDVWTTGKIDMPSTLIGLAAIAVALDERAIVNVRTRVLLASALFGVACATKYTIWIFAPGFLAALLHAHWRSWHLVATSLGTVTLAVLPHLIRNTLWTGNPIAPFGQSLFPTVNVFLSHQSDAVRLSTAQLLALPYTLFFNWEPPRYPGPAPLILLGGLAAWILIKAPRPRIPHGAAAALMTAVWIAVRREEWLVTRFLLIPQGLFLMASAASLQRSRLLRPIAIGVTIATIVYSGLWTKRHYRSGVPFLTGRMTREDFYRPYSNRPYAVANRLVRDLGPGERLFMPILTGLIPYERWGSLSTEADAAAFASIKDPAEKAAFLDSGRYRHYFSFGSGACVPRFTPTQPTGVRYILCSRESQR